MDYTILTRFEDWAEPVNFRSHLLPGEYACFASADVEDLQAFAAECHSQGKLGNSSWLLGIRVADGTTLTRTMSAQAINHLLETSTWWISVELLDEFWLNWEVMDYREKASTMESISILDVPLEEVVRFVLFAKINDISVDTLRESKSRQAVPEFFRQFAKLVDGLPIETVDKLVWAYLFHPCWVTNISFGSSESIEVIRAMIHPFRDFLANLDDDQAGNQNGFFMWFDLWKSSDLWAEFPDEVLAVLTETLYLPSAACQAAALHGLNHLAHPDREVVIDTWANSKVADRDLIPFARECRAGRYL